MLLPGSIPGQGTRILQDAWHSEKKTKKKQRKWSEDSLLQSLRDNLQNTHRKAEGTPGGALRKALICKSRKQAHLLVA